MGFNPLLEYVMDEHRHAGGKDGLNGIGVIFPDVGTLIVGDAIHIAGDGVLK